MGFAATDHTFAVCAYKESPYLRECVLSLLAQTVSTNILIATSTPTDATRAIADEFGIPLFIRDGEPGICDDWNFAVSCASTPLVTIAHQDDTYKPEYSERMLAGVNSCKHPLLYFTNYAELRDGSEVSKNRLLAIKRMLLAPLKDGRFSSSIFVRRRALSIGSTICCPSVTMVLPNVGVPVFVSSFKSNLDWDTWDRLSRLNGDYYYDSKILMCHRVHDGSETSRLIKNDVRTLEDVEMLEHFWPKPLARLINHFYAAGQASNAS